MTWTPKYKPGDQVRVDTQGGRYGIVLMYHSEDEDYYVLLLGDPNQPDGSQYTNEQWWSTHWQAENTLEPADNSFPAIPGLSAADHVFLVGPPSAVANIEVFAGLPALTEAYPGEKSKLAALGAVADPDEPQPLSPNGNKKRSVRFAEVLRPQPDFGIRYAKAQQDPDGTLIHVCPDCGERIPEEADSDGEATTTNYLKHWTAQHG